jgi:DNA-binding MarR family transcriptional regulator
MALSLLQQEIKQTRPFPSPEVEAYLNLARTFGLLACEMERFFKSYGVSAAGYNVLRILNGAKRDGEEGLPTLEVAQRLVSPVPDVTRLIDRLLRDGLVTRDRGAEDRRVVYVAITTKAQTLLRKIEKPLAAHHKNGLGRLARADLKDLIRLLEKARGGM